MCVGGGGGSRCGGGACVCGMRGGGTPSPTHDMYLFYLILLSEFLFIDKLKV